MKYELIYCRYLSLFDKAGLKVDVKTKEITSISKADLKRQAKKLRPKNFIFLGAKLLS